MELKYVLSLKNSDGEKIKRKINVVQGEGSHREQLLSYMFGALQGIGYSIGMNPDVLANKVENLIINSLKK